MKALKINFQNSKNFMQILVPWIYYTITSIIAFELLVYYNMRCNPFFYPFKRDDTQVGGGGRCLKFCKKTRQNNIFSDKNA